MALFNTFDSAQLGLALFNTFGLARLGCIQHRRSFDILLSKQQSTSSKQHVTSNFSQTTTETKLLPTCSLTHLLFARRLWGLSMGMERGIW
jgi:hypothetical protein